MKFRVGDSSQTGGIKMYQGPWRAARSRSGGLRGGRSSTDRLQSPITSCARGAILGPLVLGPLLLGLVVGLLVMASAAGALPKRVDSATVRSQAAAQVATVSAGDGHSLAVLTDGTLLGWGDNSFGAAGAGAGVSIRRFPAQVGTADDWAAVSADGVRSYGLKTDGSLWAWGDNSWGRLGDGTEVDRYSPVRIGSERDWIAVSAGWDHTLALKEDGSLWVWGANIDGALGEGSTIDRTFPVRIGSDFDWAAVSAGSSYSLAVKTDGSLWGWGWFYFGEGVGHLLEMPLEDSPVRIGTDTGWSAVEAGVGHALALSPTARSGPGERTSTAKSGTEPRRSASPRSTSALTQIGCPSAPATASPSP